MNWGRLFGARATAARKIDTGAIYSAAFKRGPTKVTASDVAAYTRSPFFLYCNKFVDKKEQDDTRMLEALATKGLRHEQDVSEAKTEGLEVIMIKAKNQKEAFRISLNHMFKGTKMFEQSPLFWLPDGMVGIPDMLERRHGKSIFGGHHYSVVEIKSRKNIMLEHIMQTAFYSMMLGKIQQRTPKTFTIINSEGVEARYMVAEYEGAVREKIAGVRRVLAGHVPSATHGCPPPWTTYANKMAKTQMDVSLVVNVGAKKKAALEKKGIRTIHDMIKSPDVALSTPGISQKQLKHAQVLLEGKPARISGSDVPERQPVEIFLDFEGAPGVSASEPAIFLIGMAVRRESIEYVSFVAESLEDEGRILKDFMTHVDKLPADSTIYHWHNYECVHLEGMCKRHDTNGAAILDRLVDLHRITTDMFVFPTSTTSLKALEYGMGFDRQQTDMDAFESYLVWCNTPKDINRVLAYNQDDCEAMISVLDWLRTDGVSWRPGQLTREARTKPQNHIFKHGRWPM